MAEQNDNEKKYPTEAAKQWAKERNSAWVPDVAPEEVKPNYRNATEEEIRATQIDIVG